MDMFFFDFLTNGPYDWVQGKYLRDMNDRERADFEARHPDIPVPKRWRPKTP